MTKNLKEHYIVLRNINAVKVPHYINIHMPMPCFAEWPNRGEELKIPINQRVVPLHKKLNSPVKSLRQSRHLSFIRRGGFQKNRMSAHCTV